MGARWRGPAALALAGLLVAGTAAYLMAGKGETGGAPGVRQAVKLMDGGRRAVLSVENAGPQPLRLRFRTAQAFEARVLAGDREVWRWSADQMFAQVITELTLGPGEGREWAFTLPELPPGTYTLEAGLLAEGLDLQPARVELTVR